MHAGGVTLLSGRVGASPGGTPPEGPHAARWAPVAVSVWVALCTHTQGVLSVSLSVCLSQYFISSPSREIWKSPGPRVSWAPMSTELPHALSFTFPLVILHLNSILRQWPSAVRRTQAGLGLKAVPDAGVLSASPLLQPQSADHSGAPPGEPLRPPAPRTSRKEPLAQVALTFSIVRAHFDLCPSS